MAIGCGLGVWCVAGGKHGNVSRSPSFPECRGSMSLTEIEDIRREASWGEENDESSCEHVDSEDP